MLKNFLSFERKLRINVYFHSISRSAKQMDRLLSCFRMIYAERVDVADELQDSMLNFYEAKLF